MFLKKKTRKEIKTIKGTDKKTGAGPGTEKSTGWKRSGAPWGASPCCWIGRGRKRKRKG